LIVTLLAGGGDVKPVAIDLPERGRGMKKFINHVDHVAWLSRPENLDDNVAQLEKLTGATLTRFARKDMGFTMCISWEAGSRSSRRWTNAPTSTNGYGASSKRRARV
jgi:hypothetical protein